MTLEQIWEIEDENDLIIALSDYLDEKCGRGRNMDALSAAERVIFITQSLEMEVNNGGFSQYFFNTAGDFAGELVSAFEAIGAEHTAAICRRAVEAFGQEIPTDRAARQELLEALEDGDLEEILDECDGDFYDYEDDLTALNYDYAMKNKELFS